MSAVDIASLREGDTVLVRGTVVHKFHDVLVEWHDGCYNTVRKLNIASVEPRPLAVGDKVKDGDGYEWIIIALDGSYAWCRCDDGLRFTKRLDKLVRA